MQNGIEQLRTGAEALCDWESPLRDRLAFAADRVWHAYFFRDQWPDSLERQADELVGILCAHGSISATVARMTEEMVPDVSSRLLEFIEQAELVLAGRQVTACA